MTLTPDYSAAGFAAQHHRQKLTQARLALRIDRYYRHESAFPQSLEEIKNELPTAPLREVPQAILSQQPPVYRALPDGFQLYDVGNDGKDNQLQPVPETATEYFAPRSDIQETGTLLEVKYPPSK